MIKIGKFTIGIASIFWISEIIFFGYNITAQSKIEKRCDMIISYLFIVGFVIVFWGIVNIIEKLDEELKKVNSQNN